MKELIEELREIERELQEFIDESESPQVLAPLSAIEDVANEMEKAWSHSWLGYHSKTYYEGLKPSPPGAHFSVEWGRRTTLSNDTTGDWREFDFDAVKSEIFRRAKNPKLTEIQKLAVKGEKLFRKKRDQSISILETVNLHHKDPYVSKLLEDAKKDSIITASDYVSYRRPSGTVMTRDTLAMSQGLWTPPHIAVLAEVISLRGPAKACQALAKIAQNAFSHLERIERQHARTARVGTNVFIGHGRSSIWKDLKDFVQDRLSLPWDEFNRIPIAGVTNIARLSEMLDAAGIAFIVMTAEDEQADGQMHARMNVIHEAGLFQGRLGFTKAIVLLEDGCEEFSNIHGLGQIRFPKGNIKAVFEEIRQILEREGLLGGKV